ncbi:hypothetical protein IVA98_20265 [Bradyrhizobium sp. 160]|uniref:hypothetical protein n=1 Tax=Bradyrhizobium sp. 160 TaxID=2782634 RepID=UPI001FF9B9A7|nr:hypothetical protein [Bradyrhizobium sp. 160]MCK1625455.1 hypothetical protein [Bradyrhizobium sp. 160]
MTEFDTLLKPILDNLQFSPEQPVVVVDQLPIGYGGQLSRRLLGLKIALAINRKAVFLADGDKPYVQSIERQFASNFGEEALHGAPLLKLDGGHDAPKIVQLDYFEAQKKLRAENLLLEKWVEKRLAEKHSLSANDLAKLDGWLLSWIRFLPEFEEQLRQDTDRLGVCTTTLGVHLRRGDKHVESPYVPASLINKAIHQIHRNWPFESIFLASDDPEADSVIEAPTGVRIVFDKTEKRYNNANHKMLMANPKIAAQETYVAFKNLRLLAQCGGIVGQDNAHFATIAASHILYKGGNSDRVVLLNGNAAKADSALIQTYYVLKLNLRKAAKQILPAGVIRFINRATY